MASRKRAESLSVVSAGILPDVEDVVNVHRFVGLVSRLLMRVKTSGV